MRLLEFSIGLQTSQIWHLFCSRRSPGQRRPVAHGQRGHQEPTDLSDPGQRAALHRRALGTTGSKGGSSFWRWVGFEAEAKIWILFFFPLQTQSISFHEVRRIYWFPISFKNEFCPRLVLHLKFGSTLRSVASHCRSRASALGNQHKHDTNYVNYSCMCTPPCSPNDARSSEHSPWFSRPDTDPLWVRNAPADDVIVHSSAW